MSEEIYYIPLSQYKMAVIDAEDFPLIKGHRWYAKRSAYNYYAVRAIKCDGKVIHIRMHRLIMGAVEGQVVHHRDGDSLNNRRENLVICTQRENLTYYRRGVKNANSNRAR